MKTLIALLFTTSIFLAGPTAGAATKGSNMGKKITEIKVDYLKSKPELAGKAVMLEFWATWCGPCRASIPHVNEIHKKFESKGLVVIGITEEPNQQIKSFVKENKMEYNIATDKGGKLNKELGISGIPHAVILNKAGEVVWEGHPAGLTDADIEKALK